MRQPANEGRHNRLARETSPYLLQHASNPVDWYPWGDEAFEAARTRNVPIFLSVGYSTCYWCHVMERESFENDAIARMMNDRFVCVKVDREERPDIDDIYMAATVLMTGRGGWPMSCFLEPTRLRPFWCGTYFPASPRPDLGSLPSFPQVLDGIAGAWKDQREQVVEQAQRVADAVSEQLARAGTPVPMGIGHVQDAVGALLRGFDRTHGGIGGAPKFPQPVFLELLLSVRESGGDEATLSAIDQALRVTLDRMAVGGIFDQVGGGFHRYSVDATWTIPHFEKMLYDQAQLIRVYARASAIYDDAFYALIARRCCEYLLREMASPEGGFFSAQDAEVDHREGLNYLWTPEEIRAALAGDDAELAIRVYGLDLGANFRDPHHADEPASNVLRLRDRPDAIAGDFTMDEERFARSLERINAGLLRVREKRKQPATDDKVLAGWNGLAIAALSDAGRILGEDRFIEGAARAAEFLLRRMVRDGTILRSWRQGTAKTPGFLEDSAFLIEGLLALHGATGRADLVDRAMEHVRVAREAFGDTRGGFFDTRDAQSDLFVRSRSTHDGAVPSAAGVMLHNLITLHEITRERAFLDQALAGLRSLSPAINDNPVGSANGARALLRLLALGADREDRITFGDRSGTPAIDPAPNSPAFTPVEVFASDDRVEVGKEKPASLEVRVRIAPGYHLVAADPGQCGAGLIPTRVHLTGGTGVAVFADYPKGEAYPPGSGDGPLVYRGTVEMTVALERTGTWSGRPIIAITYQACTDTECLSPRTLELDVAIDRVD